MKKALVLKGIFGTFMFLIFSFICMAQTHQVSGIINDQNGKPLNGATITEKGTKNATQSDEKGSFSINVQ